MKQFKWVLIIFPVFLWLTAIQVQAFFDRNLQIGSQGEDVRVLQQLLNRDPDTQVAASGPGSPGQETNYFGTSTANAVTRFQEKHREQILDPLNLPGGTGILGTVTRIVLNQLYGDTITGASVFQSFVNFGSTTFFQIPPPPPPLVDTPVSVSSSTDQNRLSNDQLEITRISPDQGGVNTLITIRGSGFAESGNSVFIGSNKESNVDSSSNGRLLVVRVKDPFNFSLLESSATVEDEDGNRVTVTPSTVHLRSLEYGSIRIPLSLLRQGRDNLRIPMAVYVETPDGKKSNTKFFTLEY